jgi:hypothetical protein
MSMIANFSVNVTGLRNTKELVKHYFWMCLLRVFPGHWCMSLSRLSGEELLSMWVGTMQSAWTKNEIK